MIKILRSFSNGSFERVGVVKNVIDAKRVEEINGENTLNFSAVLDEQIAQLINDNSMFELDDYFDIAVFKKLSNEDGSYTVEIEAEHISYRLNEQKYDVEEFTGESAPFYVLSQILEGTGFTVGRVDIPSAEPFYVTSSCSRRRLLMDYVNWLNGEIMYNKFEISIVAKRGDSTPKAAVKDNNIKVISRECNKRDFDKYGNPLISYTCEPVYLPNDDYELGDAVTVIERGLRIREHLRVVRIEYNPYVEGEVTLVFGVYINGLDRSLFMNKGEAVIDEEEVEKIVDKKLEDLLDDDFLANLDLTSITNNFTYSDSGVFSNAIVKRLRTDLSKPWRYLANDTSDVFYQDIGDTDIASGRYFKVDKVSQTSDPENPEDPGEYEEVQFTIPSITPGAPEPKLWWYEGKKGGKLTDVEKKSYGDVEMNIHIVNKGQWTSGGSYVLYDVVRFRDAVLNETHDYIYISDTPNKGNISPDSDDSENPWAIWTETQNPDGSYTLTQRKSTPAMAYKYTSTVVHRHELRKTKEGWWGVREQYGIGEDLNGRAAGVIHKDGQFFNFIMDPGNGDTIGGDRVSSALGPEYWDKDLMEWVKPGGGGNGNNILLLDHFPTGADVDPLPIDTIIMQYDPIIALQPAPNPFGP